LRHLVALTGFLALQRMHILRFRIRFSASGNRAIIIASYLLRRGWDFHDVAFSPDHFEPKRPWKGQQVSSLPRMNSPVHFVLSALGNCPLCHPGPTKKNETYALYLLLKGIDLLNLMPSYSCGGCCTDFGVFPADALSPPSALRSSPGNIGQPGRGIVILFIDWRSGFEA
jgi:hypothetical protein